MIELMEKVDDHWYFAANADLGTEGLILIADLNVVKRLPGKTTVEGFEDGPCAVATHSFEGREFFGRLKHMVVMCGWAGLVQSLCTYV